MALRLAIAFRSSSAVPQKFQRVLFNSQTYQRAASETPNLEHGPYLFPGPLIPRMNAEELWDSLVVLSVGPDVDNVLLRRGNDCASCARSPSGTSTRSVVGCSPGPDGQPFFTGKDALKLKR